MPDLDEMLEMAGMNVNDAALHYDMNPGGLAQEFVELKLQACLFQYDICREMVSLVRSQAGGFASSVAMKGLVLRMFEYDVTLNSHWIPRLLKLGEVRSVPLAQEGVREARASWKNEFKLLRSWSAVRNKAAGHYDEDIPLQVVLLRGLVQDEVMTVARAFLTFNMALLVMLRDVGRGVGQEAGA